ncbi:cytochrome P450 [Atractiella rhizophila]|nr:cytochrome P450 [Atractiella rhizophila]
MISTFIFCMAYRPDVVDKAHEELDRVIGQDRMPDFPDENSLPYVQAVIQECLRWRSVIAGGLAHASIEDDVYEGYFIPKGSTVLACHWSIHMDPDTFPQPEKFLPERFIQDGKFSDHGTVAFGLGRRKCPGQWIAERSLFIVFSRILWAFKIGPEFDASGKKYPLDPDAFTPGFSSHPQHFQCRIEPRGDWVKEIIYQAIEKQNVGEL